MKNQKCFRQTDVVSEAPGPGCARTATSKAWLGFVAAVCLWACCAPQVHATRLLLPTCETLYPSFGRASLDAVLGMLRTADFRKSRCLVDQLPRFGESAVPPLTALLHEGPEQGRVNAAAGLAGLREQALPATPALELALDDPSASVRWMVLNALASIEPRSPTLTLDVLRRLQRATPGTLESETLIYTVSHMGSLPPEALPTFAHVLEGLPSYDRRAAEETIDAISHVAAPQRMVLLAQLVGDKDAGRSWHATLAMGRSGLLAMPVLLSRLIDHPGQRGDAYWRALDWAWTVASAPSLSTYYQTDMTALMRQLRDPRPSGKAQALKRLAGLAPAFQLQLSDSWHGDEENRMPQVRCEVLDALADGAGRVADQAERQSMIAIAVSLRQAAPNSSCPIQIY